jgi:outer membrane receptor protein involved in Fe transport
VNKTKYDENGQLNHTYLDRVPNTPYFFANLNISKQFDGIIAPADQIRLNWYSRYVNEFFLQWPGHGLVKHTIPTQFVHNIEFNYSLRDGRYNASLLVSNLFDSKAYDNFRIQKPGRAVHIKLRYFLN